MAVWPGQHTLRPDSNAEIGFRDIEHIVEYFSPSTGRQIRASNDWGQQILDICKESEAEEQDKRRRSARVLLKLLEALCFEAPTGAPDLHLAADIWFPPACPVLCSQRHVLNVYDHYPKARLGVCLYDDKPPYTIEVQLHRFSCWLARGQPPSEHSYACHACHTPQCVRLHCLSWGSAQSNQQDAFRRQPPKKRRR